MSKIEEDSKPNEKEDKKLKTIGAVKDDIQSIKCAPTFNNKQELPTLRKHPSPPSGFCGSLCCSSF